MKVEEAGPATMVSRAKQIKMLKMGIRRGGDAESEEGSWA